MMTYEQEREEALFYEALNTNEYQNAAALSMQEKPVDHRIYQALEAGYYVVVNSVPYLCPMTDAYLGETDHFIDACTSYREAVEVAASVPVHWDEERVWVKK